MTLKAKEKVLVTNLSLQYSDYKNLDAEVVEVIGDRIRVAIDKKAIFEEDLRELPKQGDNVLVSIPKTSIA